MRWRVLVLFLSGICALAQSSATWQGTLLDRSGAPVADTLIAARSQSGTVTATTDASGRFTLVLPPGTYMIHARTVTLNQPLVVRSGQSLAACLQLDNSTLLLNSDCARPPGTTHVALSTRQVADLPLNKRDFTQLLTLASGTTTDTNGASNFTQQFAINGQRATTAAFAIDGFYTTDPELGGATFANFNVDAIQEIDSQSGVMPAEIGAGAAGYTNVITKSGTDAIHGSAFEFVRNAALDARNFFDRRSLAQPHRIPPFQRNEFGFTIGGPATLPLIDSARNKTYWFGEYQGFRQVLGTTQVLSVPSAAERQGLDTTAFPGDTLYVPVNPAIQKILARYPLPNDSSGPYGPRTYAISSKISTDSNQISVRLDRQLSSASKVFARFTYDNITGPTTNPSQIAIDPLFAQQFVNHQRNAGLTLTHGFTNHLTSESTVNFVRTTPVFINLDHQESGLVFADGLFEGFNAPAGTYTGVLGNLPELRQNFTWTYGAHTLKWGFDGRWNRDTTVFGLSTDGQYTFGGGTTYSPVAILSASGQHNIAAGAPLPDTLSAFLTATPYSYTAQMAGGPQFPQGDHIGESAETRDAYNFFFQDSWKPFSTLAVNYGLRYELNSRIGERGHRTSGPVFVNANGGRVSAWTPGAREEFVYDPQPPYSFDWSGWGPRLSLDWQVSKSTVFHAGGAITTVLPNMFNDDFLTASFPFVITLFLTSQPGVPVAFQSSILHFNFPPIYKADGTLLMQTNDTRAVPANTVMDFVRFERDLAALTGGSVQAFEEFLMGEDFRNGYIESWSAGMERALGDLNFSAAYIGTAGVHVPTVDFPNGYPGADPSYAPYTLFDTSRQVAGGFGPEYLMTSRSHSTYHSVQASLSKTSSRAGVGFQVSYTLAKAIDDASSVLGQLGVLTAGVLVQPFPQNPRNPGAEKGPSTFDIRHIFTSNVVQVLPFDRFHILQPLGRRATTGWQLFNVTTITSGAPFTVYSGVQQTGAGYNEADRPDLVSQPTFSTGRPVREDYFGAGANNAQYFSIPIGIPGGTGPNQGRFGTLGRNTFRGPALHEFDLSLIKDTPLVTHGSTEATTLELRAEVFNALNLVNFGLPSNIIKGSGFGVITSTAAPSRQIQISAKVIF